MKRTFLLTLFTLAIGGCTLLQHRNGSPYENPFYSKYLDPANPQDAQIQATVAALRANPGSPILHNDLGVQLSQKGFPKDAEIEFERAVDADRRFYPAWYNLALLRASKNDYPGARRAFYHTIRQKPGHAAALFQLGLIEEKRHNVDRAVALYAKAFAINPALLDVRVNPRILDVNVVPLALIKLYPKNHSRHSLQFQPAPQGYVEPPQEIVAPSPQAPAQKIVTPAPPVTNPAMQPAPATTT